MKIQQAVSTYVAFKQSLGMRFVNWPPKNGRHEVCYVDLVEVE